MDLLPKSHKAQLQAFRLLKQPFSDQGGSWLHGEIHITGSNGLIQTEYTVDE